MSKINLMPTGSRLEHDKLSVNFAIKVPAILHVHLDKLTGAQKKLMNERLLVTMAKFCHDQQFDPSVYLKED